MRIGIVEPVDYTSQGNPGWHMINGGIRFLFGKAFAASGFVSLPMMDPWNDREKDIARECDILVLAGNPRYYGGDHEWLYSGVMDQMIDTGRPMIDAWQGAAVPLGNGVEHDAYWLLDNPRNQRIIDRLRKFDAIITRDSASQRVNELSGLNSVHLPCSSWWAADYYGIKQTEKSGSVFIAQNTERCAEMIRRNSGCRVVATSIGDYDYCLSHDVDAELIFDPVKILELFSGAESVISCRLHSAIPAASLGCETAIIAFDSRPQAGDAFRIPWAQYGEDANPKPATSPADPTDIIRSLV